MLMKKKSIIENDVVLVYMDEQPAFFARVEKIVPDVKSGWWQITFLLLQIPLVTFTWILDNEQIRGADFTMKQTPMRIERVIAPAQEVTSELDSENSNETTSSKGRILTMNTNKNN